MAKNRSLILLFSFSVLLLACTTDAPVPEGRVRVRNDSMDSTYNVVRVSANGRSFALKPGDAVLLPKGASYIRFSRQYSDHVKSYAVRCPSKIKEGIQIKLIDVHLNRMPGGCVTVEASN